MGSRVRIRLFHILHFVRDLLFPLLKNSKSGVDDRGHRLRITHTRRRRPCHWTIYQELCQLIIRGGQIGPKNVEITNPKT